MISTPNIEALRSGCCAEPIENNRSPFDRKTMLSNSHDSSTTQLTTEACEAVPIVPNLPPPSSRELFYTGGAIAALLLLYGLIGQATRFVQACKK